MRGANEDVARIEETYNCLSGMGWMGAVRGFEKSAIEVLSLTKFLNTKWLSDSQVNLILGVLRKHMSVGRQAKK